MIDHTFLRQLGIILIAAALCLCVARRWGMPAIVAYLLAGLAIGPWTGWVTASPATDLISEMGIVLLLFLVGLELTFEKIREVGQTAVLAGLAQMTVCVSLGAGFCWLLGFRGTTLGILGVALALSSTVVAVKMLVSRGESQTLFGQIAVGVLLVQDMIVVLLLTLLGGMQESGGGGGASWFLDGLAAMGGVMGLLLVVLLLARFVLPRPWRWASRSPELLFIFSVCWCFLVVMASHALHLSHEIGSFVAGVSLAQSPYSHDLQRRVQPLIYFFVAVFFVTLGMRIEFEASLAFWGKALALAAFVMVGKLTLIFRIVKLWRLDSRVAFYSALLLSQISEFSFILAGVALEAGVLEASAVSLIGVVGLITIAVSSMMLISKERLYQWGCRRGWWHVSEVREADAPEVLSGHAIIVGMNTLGRELARRLTEKGERVLGIDVDPRKLEGLPCKTLLGDATMVPVMQEARFQKARLVISTLHIGAINDLLAYRCKELGIPCSIHAFDMNALNNLLEMEVAYLIVPKVDGIKRQNALLQERGLLDAAP